MKLIDKSLTNSHGIGLTNTGDFEIVNGDYSILSIAQNRIIAQSESWIFDDKYGSIMYNLKDTPIADISEEQVANAISIALAPMIEDGRIVQIQKTQITNRFEDSITIQVDLELSDSTGNLFINLNL